MLVSGAWNALWVGDRARVVDQNFRGAPVILAGSNGRGRIGADSTVGSVISSGSHFQVADRAYIDGDLVSYAPVSWGDRTTSTITGLWYLSAVSVDVAEPPGFAGWEVRFQEGGISALSLEPDQSALVQPGSYRSLTLKPRSTLTLLPGAYFFDSIRLEPGSTLYLPDGDTTLLHVKSSAHVRGDIQGADPAVQTLALIYLGEGAIHVNTGFSGTIIAPRGTLVADIGASEIQASLWGKNVEIHQGATLRVLDRNPWVTLSSLIALATP